MYILGNINYFSLEGLPWLLLAWFSVYMFRSLATFIHEMGHLIPALLFTQGPILINVGGEPYFKSKIGRCEFNVSINSPLAGYVSFNDQELTLLKKVSILLAGPVLSLLIVFITPVIIFRCALFTWIEVLLVGFFCSNLICFLRSILPLNLRDNKSFSKGVPSDSLQIINLLKSNSDGK